MEVPSFAAERLELVSISPAIAEAIVEGRRDVAERLLGATIPTGWPDGHDQRFLRLRLQQLERDPEAQQWLVRALVRRESDPSMIGHAGFHGAPGVNGEKRTGALELGFTVFPPYRGAGYAREAAAALIEWARREHGIRDFVASVSPENPPSLAIVRRLGFVQTGDQWDEEDGMELVFELRTP